MTTTALKSVILGLMVCAVALADDTDLPDNDIIAPKVVHQINNNPAPSGKAYTFEALVTDNGAVKQVVLFYRRKGTQAYIRAVMNPLPGRADTYVVRLPADQVVSPGLEYYIQAEDMAGNTLLRGHTVSPLTVQVGSPPVVAKASNPSAPGMLKNKWLWIGLGVVAAGVAASSGGSGGGGVPADASVVITAPTP